MIAIVPALREDPLHCFSRHSFVNVNAERSFRYSPTNLKSVKVCVTESDQL